METGGSRRASDELEGLYAHVAQALTAALGGSITGALTHPTDTLKTAKVKDSDYSAADLWRDRDAVLQSLPSNLFETTCFTTIFDVAYTILREAYVKASGNATVGVGPGLAVGMCAGMITQLSTAPLKVVALSLQTKEYASAYAAWTGLYREGGIGRFYKGIGVGLIISMLNPAIDYEVYHRLSNAVVRGGDVRALSPLSVFFWDCAPNSSLLRLRIL